MPAPVAPFVGLILGLLFAWAAAEELSRRSQGPLGSRSLVVVALYGITVYAPICGYFIAFTPDWAFVYFIDNERRTGAIDIVLALTDAMSPVAGFLMGARAASSHSPAGLLRLSAMPAVISVVFLVLAARRLTVVATYAQFHGHFGTRSLAGSTLGYAVLWMLALLSFGAVWTARSVRRFGDDASPQ